MVWQSVPHFIVAQMVGNTLTDGEGKQLSIKPHPALTRLAIAKPTASYKKWLLDPKQHEQFTGVIENTCFRVSKHGQSSALLNAPVEWWLLWGCRHMDPLRVYLLEYDDLTAAQERTIIHDNALRLLSYPLSTRVRAELGMRCEFFGLTKRDYANVIAGGSEANLHHHLNHVAITRPNRKAPAPNTRKAPIANMENKGGQPDQELPPRPTNTPAFATSPVNSPVVTHLTTDPPNPDAEPKGPPLPVAQEPSRKAIHTWVDLTKKDFGPFAGLKENGPSYHLNSGGEADSVSPTNTLGCTHGVVESPDDAKEDTHDEPVVQEVTGVVLSKEKEVVDGGETSPQPVVLRASDANAASSPEKFQPTHPEQTAEVSESAQCTKTAIQQLVLLDIPPQSQESSESSRASVGRRRTKASRPKAQPPEVHPQP